MVLFKNGNLFSYYWELQLYHCRTSAQNMYTVNCLSRFCFNDPCDLISRDPTGLHQQCSELVIVSNRSTNHYSWAEFAHWVYALWTLTPVSPYHYSWAEFARWVYTLWTLTPMQTTDLFWTLKGYWLLKEIYVNFSSFFLGVGLVVGVYFLQTKELIRFYDEMNNMCQVWIVCIFHRVFQ